MWRKLVLIGWVIGILFPLRAAHLVQVPQRLTLCYSTDLEGFRQKTRERELSRLNKLGEWKAVAYPTEFLLSQQHEPVLYFDPSAVDWEDVGLDIAGLTTLGIAKYPRTAASVRGWAAGVNVAGGTYQAYKHGVDIAEGNGDWFVLGLDAAGLIPFPPIQGMAGLLSLATDLALGFKIR